MMSGKSLGGEDNGGVVSKGPRLPWDYFSLRKGKQRGWWMPEEVQYHKVQYMQ